jgi:hypothetical protein
MSIAGNVCAQCQVGTNQPGGYVVGGTPAAWPKAGSRAVDNGLKPMNSGGIKYVFCTTGTNCFGGPGDYNFPAAVQTAMRVSFTNWTNARTSNNSGLSFFEGFSATTSDYFYIPIRRISTIGMGGASALTNLVWILVDIDGDGIGETYRRYYASVEVSYAVTGADYSTFVMSHEIGHTMALLDCSSCTIHTTIMSTGQYAMNDTDPNMPKLPTSCDNQQAHATAFP